MTPGFRYHVTTIAAIFLALGVGIVIGSSFVQSQIVDRQTKRLEALGQQFNREIEPLRASNNQYGAFIEAITPLIIANRLAGIRVALIQTGDYPETVRTVREILERAGAHVESETVIAKDFTNKAVDHLPEIVRSIAAKTPPPADAAGLLSVLAEALGKPGRQNEVEALAVADLVETSGDYSRPVSFVVLIGGAELKRGSRAETVDLPLINVLKPLVNTVIAVEPAAAEVSYIEALRGADIPTVDNADSDIGRISVVLALQGTAGDYGIKQTARGGALPQPAQR